MSEISVALCMHWFSSKHIASKANDDKLVFLLHTLTFGKDIEITRLKIHWNAYAKRSELTKIYIGACIYS